MTTRRTFIRVIAGTVPVALAAPGLAGAPAHPGGTRRVPRAVIVDDSLASARAFGGRLRLHGIPVLSIAEGDITALWLEHLRPLWASGPVPVAGLTTPATLFCLEQLAWQHRLRVTFHAEHVMQSGAGIEHTVQRDSHSRRLTAAALRRAGGRWPQRLADALATQRVQNTPRPGPSLAALLPTLPAGAKLLTSWIIA